MIQSVFDTLSNSDIVYRLLKDHVLMIIDLFVLIGFLNSYKILCTFIIIYSLTENK